MFLGQLGKECKEVSLRFSECLYNHKVGYPNVTIKGQMPNQMGVDQNIVAGVLLEMTLRPPLRFLALFRDFTVFHYID